MMAEAIEFSPTEITTDHQRLVKLINTRVRPVIHQLQTLRHDSMSELEVRCLEKAVTYTGSARSAVASRYWGLAMKMFEKAVLNLNILKKYLRDRPELRLKLIQLRDVLLQWQLTMSSLDITQHFLDTLEADAVEVEVSTQSIPTTRTRGGLGRVTNYQ